MAAHPGILSRLDLDRYGGPHAVVFAREILRLHQPGTVLFWDPIHGDRNSEGGRAFSLEEIKQNHWIELDQWATERVTVAHPDKKAGDVGGPWHVFVSPEPAR